MAEFDEIKRLLEDVPPLIRATVSNQRIRDVATFSQAERGLNEVLQILEALAIKPVEELPVPLLSQITAPLREFKSDLDRMEVMRRPNTVIGSQQIAQAESALSSLVSKSYGLINLTAPWVAYISDAMRDVLETKRQIRSILEEVAEARDDAKRQIGVATGEVGAQVHSKHFGIAAVKSWVSLGAAVLLLVVTMGLGWWMYEESMALLRKQAANNVELNAAHLTLLAGKLFVLSVGLSATVWCGKVFKAFQHQKTLFQHKALSIDTFESFVSTAGDDLEARRVILIETTRAIFSTPSTGFASHDQAGPESNINIFEFVKALKNGGG